VVAIATDRVIVYDANTGVDQRPTSRERDFQEQKGRLQEELETTNQEVIFSISSKDFGVLQSTMLEKTAPTLFKDCGH
jgi:hypothetical protein